MSSKTVRLRALKKEDSQLFYEWITDKELVIFNSAYKPVSEFDHDKWVESMLIKRADIVLFVIEEILSNKTIGSCQLMHIDTVHRNAELQIRIGEKQSQSKGLGSEAVLELLKFGFRDMNLHRIYLHVFSTNERAIKAYSKCGFTIEGKLREAAFIDGMYIDILVMGILKSESE